MKTGYLLKDRKEKFTTKRSWFVKAWRIVDDAGEDLVVPWMDTKAEAIEIADMLNIKILEAT